MKECHLTLGYTTDDNGVWLFCDNPDHVSHNLGFGPTPEEALRVARNHKEAVQRPERKRFEMWAGYKKSDLAEAGTIVVKPATAYGFDASFETETPCCGVKARIDADTWAGVGAFVTCRSCKWKWEVFLADPAGRLPQFKVRTGHPHIRCDRAEWVSRGFGTRPYRKKVKSQ